MAYFHTRPPLCLLSLLSDGEPTVQRSLKLVEPLGSECGVVRQALQASVWPSSVYVREALAVLSECDFGFVPQALRQELVSLAEMPKTTLPVERGHSIFQQSMRQSIKGALGRTSKMHRLMISGLLEADDRPVPIASADHIMAARAISITNGLMQTDKLNFCLGRTPSLRC